MSDPSASDIDSALQQIERSELPESHPRKLARAAIAQFILDRDKGEKPLLISNIHDNKGAPVLNVNEVLRRSEPNYGK